MGNHTGYGSSEYKHNKKLVADMKQRMFDVIGTTNVMAGEEAMVQGMVEALQESHRTLQQSFFRVFNAAMIEYANTRTDARNEEAVKFAKNIVELDQHFPFV